MGIIVDSSERIKIPLFLNTHFKEPKLVANLCPLIQGKDCKSACKGLCFGKWALCDDKARCLDTIGMCEDKEGRLPLGTEEFTIEVVREDFRMLNYAESKSYDEIAGETRLNHYKFRVNRFRLMLKSWALNELDERLAVHLMVESKAAPEQVSNESFGLIMKMPHSLLSMIISYVHAYLENLDAEDNEKDANLKN